MAFGRLWLFLEVIAIYCIARGTALMCYVCGQNGVLDPGECPTQFQYNCTSFAQAKGLPAETALFCRTMRHKTENNTYNVFKECTTKADHQRIFPDGKLSGCDSLFDNTGLEVTYCICNWNMCNKMPLHTQLQGLKAPALPPGPIIIGPPSRPRLPQGNISVATNVKLEGAPEPLPDSILVAHSETQNPILVGQSDHEASLENPEVVDLVTDGSQSEKAATNPAGGLVCMICGEGNLSEPNPECRKQHAMDCSVQYPNGVQTYCFSRNTKLSNGLHAIEKLCLSGEALLQEYGDGVVMSGCASSWQGRVEYCVCNTSRCNEQPISTQLALNPPHSLLEQSATAVGGSVKGAKNCFVCGEQNLSVPTDCSQMYEYDCNVQYPADTEVLCLTRQTVLSTGLYAIEKRCVSVEEHKEQYPDVEVVMKGCGQAWNNYVEYCVCDQDYCNHKNITVQRLMHTLPKGSSVNYVIL